MSEKINYPLRLIKHPDGTLEWRDDEPTGESVSGEAQPADKLKLTGGEFVAIMFCGFVLGAMLSGGCVSWYMHEDAIEHNAGHWTINEKTGNKAFQWK